MALTNSAQHYLEALAKGGDQVVFAYEIPLHHFAYLNPAFGKVWHRKRKSIQDNPQSLVRMIHPEDLAHVQQLYQDLVKGVLIQDIEFRIKVGNQQQRWVCIKPQLLPEQVIIGFANDISSQKEYNNTLKKHADKKNAILNILSHDLASPLANIQALAALLESDLQLTGNQEVQEIIRLIEKSSEQGIHLIQEFIKKEFLESASVTVLKRRVNLVAKLKESLQEYQQTQAMTGKQFNFVTASDSIYLALDDNKFMQAINNLISNALKFTPDGGEITIALEEKETSVLITVADNGIGIPQQYQATLFEKFSPARRTGIKGEPSVGLGMFIIKTIVEWHQGRIWFKSRENQGTTFYIEVAKT